MTDEKDELEVYFEGEDHPISTEPEQAPVEETDENTQVETESEPTSENTTSVPEGYAPIAALQDERRKAQQAREEAEMLRKQLPVQEEAPDPYEDIEKYNAWMRKQWEDERNREAEQARRDAMEDERSQMLEKHTDYDLMEQTFMLMTIDDKSLIEKMQRSESPAQFVYEKAKSYRESLLPKAEPQVETETPIREVPNLAKATAQASNTPQVEQEATIDDIFADMQY